MAHLFYAGIRVWAAGVASCQQLILLSATRLPLQHSELRQCQQTVMQLHPMSCWMESVYGNRMERYEHIIPESTTSTTTSLIVWIRKHLSSKIPYIPAITCNTNHYPALTTYPQHHIEKHIYTRLPQCQPTCPNSWRTG